MKGITIQKNDWKTEDEEDEEPPVDYWKNIKQLNLFLSKYVLNKHEEKLEDISDYLASNYINFLKRFISTGKTVKYYKQFCRLIYSCVYLIKKSLKKFYHCNLFFICVNTVLTFLTRKFRGKVVFEFSLLDIFKDLILNSKEWFVNGIIALYGKLFFIRHLLKYAIKKGWVTNQSKTELHEKIMKLFDNKSIKEYVERGCAEKIVDNNDMTKNMCDDENTFKLEKLIKRFVYVSKDESNYWCYSNNIIETAASYLKRKNIEDYLQTPCKLYEEIKTIENEDIKVIVNGKPVSQTRNEIFISRSQLKRKKHYAKFIYRLHNVEQLFFSRYIMHNGTFADSVIQVDSSAYFILCKQVLNMIVEYNLSIYIIEICVEIILELCVSKEGLLLVCDHLTVLKFFIRKDRRKSEKLLLFINLLIQEADIEKKKFFLFKFLKSIDFCFFLLNSENSELKSYSEVTLLQWIQTFMKNTCSNNYIHDENDRFKNKLTVQYSSIPKHYINLTNMILFHMDYICELLLKKKNVGDTEMYLKIEKKKKEYEKFFDQIKTDCLGKCYIKHVITEKKERIFEHPLFKMKKINIIRNNIIEIENLLRIFFHVFRFLEHTQYFTFFIIFTIYLCKTIEKICKRIPEPFLKHFFFIIKRLCIQTQLMLENLRELEENKKEGKKEESSQTELHNPVAKDWSINLYSAECKDVDLIGEFYFEQQDSNVESNEDEQKKKKKYVELCNKLIVKKLIRKIKRKLKIERGNILCLLLKELYETIIDFVFPLKKKALFFTVLNKSFYKDILLSIVHLHYTICNCSHNNMEFFFFKIFYRIKKKIFPKLLYTSKKENTLNKNVWWNSTLNKKINKKINGNSCNDDVLKKKDNKYMPLRIDDYCSFLLDFLKTFLLFDTDKNIFTNKTYIKEIFQFCKILLLKYKFFVSSKSTTNCFILTTHVLFYLYKMNCKMGKNKMLASAILHLLFFSTKKSLRCSSRKDKIFFFSEGRR